jgi:polar amino acid transport system substrate-binding protein
MRRPTARSIAGSAGLAAAFAFGLPFAFPLVARLALGAGFLILLPPLTSDRFLHVHENYLQTPRKCDHNFILVKIGLNGVARNSLVERQRAARAVFNPGGGAMALKRLVQAAMAAFVLTTTMPVSAQQVLKVGSTPTGVPFTFLDTKTNSIQGVMVDLITELGKDAGFQVQIEPMQFSTLIPSLTSSKIDIISAAMFATAARKEVIDFSDAVYTYGEGLLVPKGDTKAYATLEDLKGEVVGAQVGTAFVDALKKTGLFSEVKVYDTIPDILRDVNTGRLKAGFADYPILAYNLKQGSFPESRLVATYKPTIVGTVAIGVRKGDQELLAKINASLAKLKANGALDKILDKWGVKG